jgi:hypothetical protein
MLPTGSPSFLPPTARPTGATSGQGNRTQGPTSTASSNPPEESPATSVTSTIGFKVGVGVGVSVAIAAVAGLGVLLARSYRQRGPQKIFSNPEDDEEEHGAPINDPYTTNYNYENPTGQPFQHIPDVAMEQNRMHMSPVPPADNPYDRPRS